MPWPGDWPPPNQTARRAFLAVEPRAGDMISWMPETKGILRCASQDRTQRPRRVLRGRSPAGTSSTQPPPFRSTQAAGRSSMSDSSTPTERSAPRSSSYRRPARRRWARSLTALGPRHGVTRRDQTALRFAHRSYARMRAPMDSDPFSTQRDVGSAVVAELSAAGFAEADEVGRGGFGIVFRCRQTALDRMVAVKVLTTQMQEDRELIVREQRAMGRLTGHPNVVGVLEVGQTDSGCPYLVMQYHQRGSLEARIRRLGRLPVEEVLHVGVKIAGALEAAHRREILHRDVKPANILLTDYGEPALADFGIAHIVGGFKTATGTFTGSPAFTAPEVLSGDAPSAASDVYELGATLFAALTGHAAYERKSGEQVVAQFLRIASEPVPDLRDSGIPADVSALVEKAMSRDAWERPSAADLGEELAHVAAPR